MDDNPYRSPRATNEPAPPRPVRAAAKGGARLGAILVFGLYAIACLAGAIPAYEFHAGRLLIAIFVWSFGGVVVGAALGAFFQAIANAALRRAAGKRQTSD